jgi:hypothetical protein
MTDIGELVSYARLDTAVRRCPFKLDPLDVDDPEGEDIGDDDDPSVQVLQDNDGGKLGKNVEKGSPGTDGSWNDIGGEAPRYKAPRVDTRRTTPPKRIRVRVPEKAGANARVDDPTPRPFTVAAHHLIPGNAALKDSAVFRKYMKRGAKMKLEVASGGKKTFELNAHIGYNVNGSHNGVWLPGSYAIRQRTSPNRETWSVLNDPKPSNKKKMLDWCKAYMAAVAKVAGGQFHDTHEEYSKQVLKAINLLAARLMAHQRGCRECETKTKIPPPYAIVKPRLYLTSRYLRGKTVASPRSWKRPWFTSDQVLKLWGNAGAKQAFLAYYKAATSDQRK